MWKVQVIIVLLSQNSLRDGHKETEMELDYKKLSLTNIPRKNNIFTSNHNCIFYLYLNNRLQEQLSYLHS